ncbi:MAG: DUF819 family protein [Bacteroidia bacterium]|nr:DUF819 family protein [Bacteroidia bacterium]
METAVALTAMALYPILGHWMHRNLSWARWLGSTLTAYLLGLGVGHLPIWPQDRPPSETIQSVAGVAALTAVPLLLFTADFRAWLRHARSSVKAFVAAVVVTTAVGAAAGRYWAPRLEAGPELAGMFTAVFIGGTPNLAAVGWALNVRESVYLQATAADALVSALYMVFLFRVARPLLSRWLAPYPYAQDDDRPLVRPRLKDRVGGLALSVVVVVFAVALAVGFQTWMSAVGYAPKIVEETFFPVVVVATTALAVALSFAPAVRRLTGLNTVADYFILVFCFGFGMLINARELARSPVGVTILAATIVYGSALIYYPLCKGLKVDRDTAIIVSAATIFSPPFIAAVAEGIGNRRVVVAGMTAGIAGYALGNPIGLALAYALR